MLAIKYLEGDLTRLLDEAVAWEFMGIIGV